MSFSDLVDSLINSFFHLFVDFFPLELCDGRNSQAAAPAAPAQTPAEVLSAGAHRFFNEITSLNIRQDTPHKIALLINVDGRRVALFTRDLPPASTDTNPFREFCGRRDGGFKRDSAPNLSLTPQSTVELCVADIRRHIEPEARSPNAPASYRLLTTTLIAADNVSIISLAMDIRTQFLCKSQRKFALAACLVTAHRVKMVCVQRSSDLSRTIPKRQAVGHTETRKKCTPALKTKDFERRWGRTFPP